MWRTNKTWRTRNVLETGRCNQSLMGNDAQNALVKRKGSFNITKDRGCFSEMWSEISETLFGKYHQKKRQWLRWVIWSRHCNGVRDLINTQQETSLEMNEACHAWLTLQDSWHVLTPIQISRQLV